MERNGVRELRQSASRHLAMVKAGQTAEVTERGELIALLVPPHRSDSGRDRLVAAGLLLPATNPTGRSRAPRSVPRVPGEPSGQEMPDEMRAERL